MLDDSKSKVEDNPTREQFFLSINNELLFINHDSWEELMTYIKLLDYLQCDEENEILWKFCCILSHQRPPISNHLGNNNK
jgi:hypothetical protein